MVKRIHKDNSQLKIEDFAFLYGELNLANMCVKLVKQVLQVVVKEHNTRLLTNNLHSAHPCCVVLMIGQRLKCSNR